VQDTRSHEWFMQGGRFRDIRERLLSATSGSSWIRRQWSDDISLNDRYRLQAAVR